MNSEASYSRRQFLSTTALAAGVATALSRTAWATAASDPRVAGIVTMSIGIDTHNHIDVPLTASDMPGPDIGMAGEMKRSGLSAVCMTFATDYQQGDAYDRFLNGLASLDRQLERDGMKRSLTPAEVTIAHRSGHSTVIQGIEGAHFLQGKLERVEEAYKRGLRQFGLLHDSDSSVPLGDVYTNAPKFNGLTEFGASVIKECNRLGMLIDLAHASFETTQGALKVADGPVIVSHTGLDTQLGSDPHMAQMMRPRLISKEQAQLVADAGGAIGVWTHLADTPLDYAKNIRALVDVIGVEHVCIGTDTKLTPPSPRLGQQHARIGERTNEAWADEQAGFYYVVVEAMLKTGFTPDEIAKIGGGNFLRLFGRAVKQ